MMKQLKKVLSILCAIALLISGMTFTLAEEPVTEPAVVEEIAPVAIAETRKIFKGVSPNVDFYSGLVYKILDIPEELYTPLFATARIVGWSAHRIEELIGMNKIIRPAYKSVMKEIE